MQSTANAPDHARLRRPAVPAPTAARTPVQHRVWAQLLGADARRADRPHADTHAGRRVRRAVLDRLGDELARVPTDTTIWLNATALAALDCEGRYLDHLDAPFAWSITTAAGSVTQHALAVEVEGGRHLPLADVVGCAWRQALHSGSSAAAFIDGLDAVGQAAVRAAVTARLAAYRDCFPALPAWLHPRVATPFTWRLSRQVVAKVVPDLSVGRPDAQRRMVQMVDLKVGTRLDTHAVERRIQALLATVKYGVAPFRVATYYLDEGHWAADDVTDAYLDGAVGTLVDRVHRAIRLTLEPPKPANLTLRAGPACNWCARAPDCPLGGQPTVRLSAA